MKAADAAGLVAARAGDVVEPALEAGDRADILQRHAALGGLLQRRDDVVFAEYRDWPWRPRPAPGRTPAAARGCKSDRRRRDRAGGEKLFRDQDRAAIEFAKMFGIEQPRLESRLRFFIGQDPGAIDLVFQRRFLERLRLRVVVEHFQQIVGTEIARRRFRRMRDLKIGLDAIDVLRLDRIERAVLCDQLFRQRRAGQRRVAGGEPAPCDLRAGDAPCVAADRPWP